MEGIVGQVCEIFLEVIQAGRLEGGQIVVLGCSTSEILGENIGKAGSEDVGRAVVGAAIRTAAEHGIYLAVQGCEHINRALVVEKECALAYGLEVVSVRPTPAAGGSCAHAAFSMFEKPVMVENIAAHAGVDIGDTHIGMQVKFVQVPFRSSIKNVGQARVTALTSRPKLIGGARAKY
ncbi:MAG: TIGR01440 family protein [Defluviitaleaceae bacterium]|nr:TIGR01440 family protein [Defluviitaleaceae bacterium]